MRTTLCVLTLLLFSACITFAQESDTMAFKHIEVGPFVTFGASIFQGDVPEGSKTDVHFPAFSLGATGIYSFHPYWGAALSLGYESRGIWFKKEDVKEPNEDITLNYLTIRPSIKFKQFLLGINIGLPLSSSFEYHGTSYFPTNPASFTKDSLNTLIDIRLEGMLPITESETGALYFHINASYCLSSAIKSFYTVAQTDLSKPVTDSPIPSVQVGLSYLFAPGGKTH
jgi:hypothetical protein